MNATNRKFLRVLCLCLCLLCCLPLLAGCGSCGGSDEPVVRNAITSVTVGRGTQAGDGTDATLTVTAALTDALLKSYSGTVYLFELPARCAPQPRPARADSGGGRPSRLLPALLAEPV